MLGRQSHPSAALVARLDHLLAGAALAQDRVAIRDRRCFAFRLGAVTFEGSIAPHGADSLLLLAADLGPLPYSAENAALRRRWLDIVGRGSGPDRHSLGQDGRLHLESRTLLSGRPSREQLLQALTVIVMGLGRHIEPPIRH